MSLKENDTKTKYFNLLKLTFVENVIYYFFYYLCCFFGYICLIPNYINYKTWYYKNYFNVKSICVNDDINKNEKTYRHYKSLDTLNYNKFDFKNIAELLKYVIL